MCGKKTDRGRASSTISQYSFKKRISRPFFYRLVYSYLTMTYLFHNNLFMMIGEPEILLIRFKLFLIDHSWHSHSCIVFYLQFNDLGLKTILYNLWCTCSKGYDNILFLQGGGKGPYWPYRGSDCQGFTVFWARHMSQIRLDLLGISHSKITNAKTK